MLVNNYLKEVEEFMNRNPKTLLAIDLSSRLNMEEYFNLMYFLRKKYPSMNVIFTDIDIKEKTVLGDLNSVKELLARGGQDYRPAFHFAENNDYDGIIYITDGYGFSPETTKVHFCWILNQVKPNTRKNQSISWSRGNSNGRITKSFLKNRI